MISRDTYSMEHVNALREKYRKDPALLERVLFAFGLLEAITYTGMPFIFKGGTSLLLIHDQPLRLSTDIDILVKPGTDVDRYLKEAAEVFPFKSGEEDFRAAKNRIEKRHLSSPMNLRCVMRTSIFSWISSLLIVRIVQLKYER